MIGDAVPVRFSRRIQRMGSLSPVRFSRRIQRMGSLLPVKVSVKKKTRRSAVKKRTSGANSSLLKATQKTKGLNPSLLKVAEKKAVKKSKLEKNSKQISKFLKQASHNLKPAVHRRSRKDISKIFGQKRKTRNSLNASQVNLTDKQNLELELSDERKKVIEKKNHAQFTGNKKQSVCRSLRVSKSSLLTKEEGKNKELNDSKLKSPRVKKLTRKKSSLQIISISSTSVLTRNNEKFTRKSGQLKRKKSARLSAESLNQEISLYTPASKSLPVTPHSEKVTRTTRRSENRKSARSSKGTNQSRILNSGISLNVSAFQSILETPHPKKHLEKRKSSRLLEPSPLRTLNKELSLSTPASVLRKNQDSITNKSSKFGKSAESRGGKRGSRKVSNKEITTDSCEKLKPSQRQKVNQQKKASENFKMPLSKETENLPLDVLSTPAFTPIHVRSISKKSLAKSDSKSSKRKFHDLATENHVASKELQDVKKRKKSAGDNVCVDNSTSPSKYRTMKKSVCPVKTDCTQKLKVNQNSESYLMPRMNIQCKIDVLTADLLEKQSRRRARSVPHKNEINCLSTIGERKGKSTGNRKRKPVKRVMLPEIPKNVNDALFSDTDTGKKASPVKMYPTKKRKRYLTPNVNLKSDVIKEDCLTADLYEVKHRRANTAPSETITYQKRRLIKTLAPIKFTPNVNQNGESSFTNSFMKELSQLPIDNLTGNESASCFQKGGERLVINTLTPYKGRKKILSWPLGNGLSSEISTKDDFPNMHVKGTLKHKRWMLNNLKETNAGYEDDIFENQNFGLYKTAFHFGDESDGSSVNIATPKFECILTPALPKKTPRFKDCISPTELLQARKTAEEYLYRRNKKRKSGDNRPSSSGKNTSMNRKNATKDIPEKKKLDFEEAVNKLIEVKRKKDKDAEIDDEEEDSYFSDASN